PLCLRLVVLRRLRRSALLPYTTLFRSPCSEHEEERAMSAAPTVVIGSAGRRLYLVDWFREAFADLGLDGRVVVTENDPTSAAARDRKSTRLNSSHVKISYAVFCLKKKS